jgi:hypothetical protein
LGDGRTVHPMDGRRRSRAARREPHAPSRDRDRAPSRGPRA